MEHGLKDIALYVQNTYNTLHSCHNFPAGSRQAARGACICETSLFDNKANLRDLIAATGLAFLLKIGLKCLGPCDLEILWKT